MSANTAYITTGAADASVQSMDEFSAGVAVHFNGDWGQHHQVNVVNTIFTCIGGNPIPNSKTLRLLVSIGGRDVAVILPIVPILTAVSSAVPAITVQPTGGKATLHGSFRLSVTATGSAPLFYQWKKNGVSIPKAVSRDFTVTNVKTSDAGSYTVLVTNSNGVAISAVAEVQVVVPVTIVDTPESGGFSFLGLILGIP